jgi:integrase
MPKLKINKTNIDKYAKPGGAADVLYWDVNGFGLRVTPTGKAVFICQGRIAGTGTDVRLTIGTYSDALTPEAARKKADLYRHQLEQGIDPRELKKQHQAEQVTLGDVAKEYLARDKLRPSTAQWISYFVDKVFADWKDKPITSITGAMVTKRHREISEKGLKGKKIPKGAPASANSAMVNLRALLNFANRQYRRADGSLLIPHLPTEVMADRWNEEGDRTQRYIAFDKVGAVWNALHEARAKQTHRDTLSAIDVTIMNLLCGGRLMEMASLKWDQVFVDDHEPSKCYWHLIERKQGKPIKLPLSTQAVVILKDRLSDRQNDNQFIFPSRSKSGHVGDPRSTLEMVSAVAGLHLSSHDLRRTFSNIAMRECLIEKFRVDILIGHKPSAEDITARNYVDLTNLQWLHGEVQKIGDWIEQKGLIAAGANILQMPARA